MKATAVSAYTELIFPFSVHQLSISQHHNPSSVSMDDLYLSASNSPTLSKSPYTADFIDALMVPGGHTSAKRRESAPSSAIDGVLWRMRV